MTIIRTKMGDVYDLDELGIRTRFFNVESPNYVNNLEEVPGRTGLVDYGSDFGTRKIEVGFRIIAVDQTDFPLYRNEIFNILTSRDSFYISESRWKSVQWLVRVEAPFSIDKRNLHGYFSINFTSVTGFAESTYTTLELHDSGYSADVEKYGLVDNIDDEKVKYRFTENEFTVYNAGNATIEPESMFLNITLGMVVTDGVLSLRNKTTGETFEWQKPVNGRNIYINGVNVSEGTAYNGFRDTNRRFISLAPGDNEFEVSGGTFSQISFDTKFYYR